MTFPLDPGLRAFQPKEAEPDPRASLLSAQPAPPACFRVEDAEHRVVTPPRPADDGSVMTAVAVAPPPASAPQEPDVRQLIAEYEDALTGRLLRLGRSRRR
jgi:hypothetical protein